MSIGGRDIVLLAPASESIADAILRVCRRHWLPATCLFQDAQGQQARSFSDTWVWMVGTSRKEFSVYRDKAAVASWREQGATKQNANTMFHFIIAEASEEKPSLVEVAMVFDKLTPGVRNFVNSLRESFLSLMVQTPRMEAA